MGREYSRRIAVTLLYITCLHTCPCIYPCTCLHTCLCTCLYTFLCTYPHMCTHSSIHMSTHMSIRVSMHMSTPMSIRVSMHIPTHMSVPLCHHWSSTRLWRTQAEATRSVWVGAVDTRPDDSHSTPARSPIVSHHNVGYYMRSTAARSRSF